MKVVLLVVRCMIPARKLLHAQTVPKAVLIFTCITTLQKNTKIVSTHVKMASGVIPVPQSLVKDALKMLKYFAWQQNTVIITILQYTAILHMRSLGWTTTVSAVNVIWCFITKMKRSGEFCDHVFHHFGPSPRRVVSTGRRMNICLCVCFSTDVYLWWEASVRLGELSSGWCFWFWYRKGVARVHECSQVLFRLQLFTCSPPAVQSPELQIPPAGIFVSWLGSGWGHTFSLHGQRVHFHFTRCAWQGLLLFPGWCSLHFITQSLLQCLCHQCFCTVWLCFSLAFLQDFMLLGNEGSCAALHPGWCTVELLQNSRYSGLFSACSVTIFSLARGSEWCSPQPSIYCLWSWFSHRW